MQIAVVVSTLTPYEIGILIVLSFFLLKHVLVCVYTLQINLPCAGTVYLVHLGKSKEISCLIASASSLFPFLLKGVSYVSFLKILN